MIPRSALLPPLITVRRSTNDYLVRLNTRPPDTHAPVLRDANTPPPRPRAGDRIGILDAPTGAWSRCRYGIATWNGRSWTLTRPRECMVVFNEEAGELFLHTQGVWAKCRWRSR